MVDLNFDFHLGKQIFFIHKLIKNHFEYGIIKLNARPSISFISSSEMVQKGNKIHISKFEIQ